MVKKDGELRPCGDYRALKARTVPNNYPVRHIEEFSHLLDGIKIFSVVDLTKAYHQIPVADDDVHKTAIFTPFSLYEYKFMSLELRNATHKFQRFIDEVTRGFEFFFPYFDDIIVFSADEDEHIRYIKRLFHRFTEYDVIINAKKYQFGTKIVNFLGYDIRANDIQPPKDKVTTTIQGHPLPKTVKELRRLLGMLNFYRRFIPQAAEHLAPLTSLLQGTKHSKNVSTWTEETTKTFDEVKNVLANATILVLPNTSPNYC